MHEMTILSNVMDTVLAYAEEANAREVTEVSLVVGEMRDVVDELMESCFRFLARDTIASNACLTMEKVPLRIQCKACDHAFSAEIRGIASLACPECGCADLGILSGREFFISSISVL